MCSTIVRAVQVLPQGQENNGSLWPLSNRSPTCTLRERIRRAKWQTLSISKIACDSNSTAPFSPT
jgi:hypothetical protein